MWLRIPVELLAFNQGSGAGGAGDGAGSGGSSGAGGTGAGTGGSGGASGDGAGDGTGGDGKAGAEPPKPGDGKTFSQEDVNRFLAEDRRREADKAARKIDTERTEAAAQALKDNAKFEELAKTRETQLVTANGQIETLTAERDALTVRVTEADAAIAKILESQTKDLPPHLKPLLDKLTPAERLAYLADNAESIRKGGTQAVPNHSGSGTGAGNGGSGAGAGAGNGTGNLAAAYIQSAYGRKKDK